MVQVINITAIRESLTASDKVISLLTNPKSNPNLRLMTQAFIDNTLFDDKLTEAVTKLKGKDGKLTLSEAISKLSYSMPNYKPSAKMTQYDYQEGRVSLASTILHALIRANVIDHTIKRIIVNGKFKTQTSMTMGIADTKELTRGINLEPGCVEQTHLKAKDGGKSLKLTSEQREFLAAKSSKALRLVKTPEDVLYTYFKQTPWYTKAREGDLEDNICLDDRVKTYVDAIVELQQQPRLYLSTWFDTRYRLYYDAVLAGINPHGKTFETSQWELADAKLINDAGKRQIIHSIVDLSTGKRLSVDEANKVFNPKKHITELMTKPMDMDKEFYAKRLVDAYNDAVRQVPSHFMLSKDATTGGLQHNGIGFRSTKSMISSNVGGDLPPQDAHQDFADAFGLSVRQDAKDLNTPLLHGSSIKTIVEILNAKHGTTHKEEYVIKHMTEAYGPEVMNIPAIAQIGTSLVNNQVSTLMFNTVDGWKAQSTAYTQSAEMNVYYLNPDSKTGYGTNKVQRNMPLHVMKDGTFFTGTGVGTKKTVAKVRGLSANMTHTIDAFCLRGVDADMFKHDNFLMHPNDMDDAELGYKQRLLEAWDYQPYHTGLKDIGAQLGCLDALEQFADSLLVGDATRSMVETSKHYLSA